MKFLKNRTVLGIVCIALALIICFVITPLFNASKSSTMKLIGLEGNRRFGDRIVAGTFFICGNGGEDFCSLPDDLCEKYVREFARPHEITQDEVEQDMGMTFICF